jgi:hypothetical protein
MGNRIALISIALISFFFWPTNATSRLIDDWPYGKLFKEAELVVMATALKTEATKDKPPKHDWPYEMVGQNTSCKVLHVLKGKTEGKQIRILHFKFGELRKDVNPNNFEDRVIQDGPIFVTFRTKPVSVSVNEKKTVLAAPQYLLFLRKMKDGRYELVSGQIDPALAVREISRPLDNAHGD